MHLPPTNALWDEQYDVAVVGAGVAGSALAAALARQGWQVALIERDQLPRHKVCGEFLSPEAQQSLHALGLYPTVRAQQPVPLSGATLIGTSGQSLSLPLPGIAWGLSRFALDATLATAAVDQGAVLYSKTLVRSYTPAARGYQLHCRHTTGEQILTARAVIMASGRQSGQQLPPQVRRGQSTQPWRRCVGLKIHLQGVTMGAQTELYLFPGGYVGINPVEGDAVNLCALLDYTTFAAAGKDVLPAIQAMSGWNPALAERLVTATPLPATACVVAGVDTGRQPRPWDGVACIGDTAAMIPPLCGDGMAMALRSAEICAKLADDFLRGRRTLAAWQSAYTRQWQQEFNQRLWIGRGVQWALGVPSLSRGLLWLGRRLPPLASYVVRATRGSAMPNTILPRNEEPCNAAN